MLKLYLPNLDAYLSLNTQNPNESKEVIIESTPEIKQKLDEILYHSYSAFGHIFTGLDKPQNPIDLHSALSSKFPDLIVEQGEEIITPYDPEIPEGAVT